MIDNSGLEDKVISKSFKLDIYELERERERWKEEEEEERGQNGLVSRDVIENRNQPQQPHTPSSLKINIT